MNCVVLSFCICIYICSAVLHRCSGISVTRTTTVQISVTTCFVHHEIVSTGEASSASPVSGFIGLNTLRRKAILISSDHEASNPFVFPWSAIAQVHDPTVNSIVGLRKGLRRFWPQRTLYVVHWCLRAETHPCSKVVSIVVMFWLHLSRHSSLELDPWSSRDVR